jgi:hypothetical protein
MYGQYVIILANILAKHYLFCPKNRGFSMRSFRSLIYFFVLTAFLASISPLPHPAVGAPIANAPIANGPSAASAPIAPAEPANRLSGPHLTEIAPAAAPGQPAWLEISLPGSQVFLPVVHRTNSGPQVSNAPAAPADFAGQSMAGWSVTDLDGNTFSLPSSLPPAPPLARLVIVFGPGEDDLDFSDGMARLHAPGLPADLFDPAGDQVGLFDHQNKLVDFFAWGQSPAGQDDPAVEAGLWVSGAHFIFDEGFGETVAAAPPDPNASFGWWNGAWHPYRAAHSSPGRANPPPVPLRAGQPDGAVLVAHTFGIDWQGLVAPPGGELLYEFELAASLDFAQPLVSRVSPGTGWAPAQPLPDGTYYWRARLFSPQHTNGPYLGPFAITSLSVPELAAQDMAAEQFSDEPPAWMQRQSISMSASSSAVVKTLLFTSEHKIQRKDTTILDIGGGAWNNMNYGLPRTGTRNRWDGPHVNNDIDKKPTFSWNGYDNATCARASAAMMVDYYGGKLSIDRISYYLFETLGQAGDNSQGSPDGDLGFGRGGSAVDALKWALHGEELEIKSYCPDPDDPDLCRKPGAGKIPFSQIKNLIDDGKPFVTGKPGHVRVVDGYSTHPNGDRFVRLLDPVPVGGSNCIEDFGSCQAARWITYETFAADALDIVYLKGSWPKKVRSDEPTIYLDSDGDGLNDFDEIVRFRTDPYHRDTDKDGITDKLDIAGYVFQNITLKEPNSYFRLFPADLPVSSYSNDYDTLRKELDWDNDGDLVPDGCEDSNGNSILDLGESSSFSKDWKIPCKVKFSFADPTTEHPLLLGPRNMPNDFWQIMDVFLPVYWDSPPTFIKSDFSGKIGGVSPFSLLNVSQAPGKVALRVRPPTQPAAGKYNVQVYYREGTPFWWFDIESNAVIYGPAQLNKTVVLAPNSGSSDDWLAGKSALKLFLAQFSPGASLGLVTLGGEAQVLAPLASITDSRQIAALQTSLDGLDVRGEPDLQGALELALQALPGEAGQNASILAALSQPPAPGDGTFTLLGDNNFDGQINLVDSLTTPFSTTVIHTLAFDPLTPWAAGLSNLASATGGSFGFAPALSAVTGAGPQNLGNRLAAAYKAQAESILGEQRLLTASGIVDLAASASYAVPFGGGESLAFSVHFADPGRGGLSVLRPDGTPVLPGDEGVESYSDDTYAHLRINNPPAGTWNLTVVGVDPAGASTEFVSFVSAVSNLNLSLPGRGFVFSHSPQGPVINLAAFLELESDPLPGAQVTAQLRLPDGSLQTYPLYDDGSHQDGAANDGLYAAPSIIPSLSGGYEVLITAQGVDPAGQPFSRTVLAAAAYQQPLAYIHTRESDHQAWLDLHSLLAAAGQPLVSVLVDEVADTDWTRFAGAIIAADSATAAAGAWGTPAARSALLDSGLPVIGLGRGGYELFNDLGLAIGADGLNLPNLAAAQPVSGAHPAWIQPLPLSGLLPYVLYTTSEDGVGLNLSPTAPPAGVEPLATDPASGQVTLVREAGRFLLWGYDAPPASLTTNGQRLLLNLLALLLVE